MAWQPKTEAQKGFYGNQATGSNIGQQFGGGVRQGLGTMQGGLGQMGQAADYYQGVLSGQQPSLGQIQQQRGLESAIQAQTAMAAQGRGGNLAAAQRQAATAGAGMAQQGVNDAAMLRISEMQGAASGLGQLGQAQAGMGLQQNLSNLGMMNDAYMNQAGLDVQYQLGQRELQEQERMGRHNRIFNWVNLGRQWAGDIANSIIGGASMSDERAKQNVQPTMSASDAVAQIPAVQFHYKPGEGPPGERFGWIAQDVERVRPELVVEGPRGKMLDNNSTISLLAATASEQEQRIRQLEGMLGATQSDRRSKSMGYSDERMKAGIQPTRAYSGPQSFDERTNPMNRGYNGPSAVMGQNMPTAQPFRQQMMPSLGGDQWSPRNSRLGSRPTIDSQLRYEAELSRGREINAPRMVAKAGGGYTMPMTDADMAFERGDVAPGLSRGGKEKGGEGEGLDKNRAPLASSKGWETGGAYQDIGNTRNWRPMGTRYGKGR